MNRREFCQASLQLGALTLGSGLLPWTSWASPLVDKPQFFILVRILGGWDTTLSMEPWTQSVRPDPNDLFLEYRLEDLLSFGSGLVGPGLLPLKKYFDRMAIINGVFVSRNDGGHESSGLYAETGNGQGQLAVVSLELEGRIFNSPFGTLANEPAYAANENKTIWDLESLATSGGLSGSDLLLDIPDQNTDLAQARRAIIQNGDKADLFNKIMNGFTDKTELANYITSAFRSRLSSSAYLVIKDGGLDTHSNHEKVHLTELQKSFGKVQTLLDALNASPGVDHQNREVSTNNLLDQTTVMIVSEFTRTPALNTSKGKDHNPQSNSTIVIGPKIKNGIHGASTLVPRALSATGASYLAGLPLDVSTHLPVQQRKDSFILRPDNVVATVVTAMGVNPTTISKDLASATVLKNLLK